MRRALFAKHAALRTPEATMAAVDGLDGDVWLREQEIRALGERLDEAEERLRESGVRLAEMESRLGEAAARFSRLEALFKEERAADRRRLEEAKIREAALAAERDALGAELWNVHHSFWWRLGTPWWKLRSLFRK
jgi:predicted  nucleic acid-binding Zn-ribbon protein